MSKRTTHPRIAPLVSGATTALRSIRKSTRPGLQVVVRLGPTLPALRLVRSR